MRSATDAREKQLLDEVSKELPNAVLERFATLVRESGSEDERIAASFISERLQELGVPYSVHRPPLYLSLPRGASLEVTSPMLVPRTGRALAVSRTPSVPGPA